MLELWTTIDLAHTGGVVGTISLGTACGLSRGGGRCNGLRIWSECGNGRSGGWLRGRWDRIAGRRVDGSGVLVFAIRLVLLVCLGCGVRRVLHGSAVRRH